MTIKNYIFIFIYFFSTQLFAQKIDTLIFFSNQKNALSHFNNKNYQKALELFKVNFNYLESIDDKLNEGNSTFFKSKYSYLTYLKDCSISINKYEDAIEYGVKAIQYYRLTYDTLTKEYSDKFAELSRLNNQIYNYDESIKFQTKALDLNEKIFGIKSKEYLMSLHYLGLYYEKDGDYLNSNRIFSKSFNIANLIYKETDTLLYNYQYEYIRSQFYNEKINESLELCKINSEKIKNFIGVENRIYIDYLCLISSILINSNEISKSIEYNLESERLARLVFGEKSECFYNSQIIKSKIFKVIGDFNGSLIIDTNLLNLCIEIYGNESHQSCLLYADIASLENKDKALIFALEASKIAEKIYNKNDVNYINILGLKAYILFSEGLYSDAIKINKKIIKFYKNGINHNIKTYLVYLSNQAYMYQYLNDTYQAEITYSEIFKLISSSNYLDDKTKRSILLDYLYFKINTKKFKVADSLCTVISNLNISVFNENILNLNDEQKVMFINHWYSINSLILEYSISTDNKKTLLDNYNKTLNYYFKEYKSKIPNNSNISNNEKLTLLNNNKNLLFKYLESNYSTNKIDSLKTIIKQQEIELSIPNFNVPNYKNFNYIDKLSKNLKKDEILIHISKNYYFKNSSLFDSSFYLISILNSNKNVEFIIFKNAKYIDSIIGINQQYLSKKINQETDSLIYTMIWKPIQEKFNNQKSIFLFCDGEINKLNFNTIFNKNINRYLIDDYDFNYITNLSDFINNKNETKKVSKFSSSVLIGNPVFNLQFTEHSKPNELAQNLNFNLNRGDINFEIDSTSRGKSIKSLPNTKIEIQNIKKILDLNNIKNQIYTEELATEKILKSIKSPNILHIATHGYFIEDEKIKYLNENNTTLGFNKNKLIENPLLRSGLLLSGADNYINNKQSINAEDNGLFSALEASTLDLNETELVVLSACETGKGKIVNGQGVQGLRKGFKDAGAKKIIMSLWKVDDKVTQEFMTTFYTLIFLDKNIKTAFYKTQLQIKEKYKLPYYWGAFVLSEY